MKKSKNILFLDIDNTLLIPDNIYIHYKKDNINISYTPKELAKINITKDEEKYYNFSEFDNKKIVEESIIKSEPIKKTLDLIDMFLENNFELGIITARKKEKLISKIIVKWLKKNLTKKFKMRRRNIYAVNDRLKKYSGKNDPEKKLNILKKYIGKYNNIFFIDDNKFTINMIKQYNKTIKRDNRINLIYVNW